jgi:predicted HD phosphohydrolase
MDQATAEQWKATFNSIESRNAAFPDRAITLLKSLETEFDGFAISQLQHCLQTATRAKNAGATEEMVVACLFHDIGKAILNRGHAEISAAILKPFLSDEVYQVIRCHQDFQARYYGDAVGRDPDAREKHRGQPWFELACRFSDDWDQLAFDPDFKTEPLISFEPMIRRVFAHLNEGKS